MQTLFLYKKELEKDLTINPFSKYTPVKPKTKPPNSFITEEIELTAKLINRPFKMVAGLTRDWSIDELRDIRTQSMKASIDPVIAWWAARKRRKLKKQNEQ